MLYTDLLKGSPSPGGYLFYGEEDYLKQHTLKQMRQLLFPDPGMADFNRFVFSEENYTPAALSDALLSPAMMTDVKLVELSLPDGDGMKEKERTTLFETLESLAGTTDTIFVLIFPAGTFDGGTPKRPSALLRSFSKVLTPVEFPEQSDARLQKWMERHLSDYGVSLSPAVGNMIRNTVGRSMLRLSGELAKVGAYAAAHGLKEVTPDAAAAVISRTPEEDAFRLANCLLEGNRQGAYDCLSLRIRRKEDPILLMAQIIKVYTDLATAAVFREEGRDKKDFAAAFKIHEYRAGLFFRAAESADSEYFRQALEKCLEADGQLKSLSMGYVPIERLIGTL